MSSAATTPGAAGSRRPDGETAAAAASAPAGRATADGAGVAVATAGVIAFVALMVPSLIRAWVGRPHRAAFYMRNTVVPLSAAYIDPNGAILEIHELKPLEEAPVTAGSDQVQYVLETKLGWFEKNGIAPGTIRLSIGLEDADDLIDDLKRALKAAEKTTAKAGA